MFGLRGSSLQLFAGDILAGLVHVSLIRLLVIFKFILHRLSDAP